MYAFYLKNLNRLNTRLDQLTREKKGLSQAFCLNFDAALKMLHENTDSIKTLGLMLETSLKSLKVQTSLSGYEQDPEFINLIAQFEQVQVKFLSLQTNERDQPNQLYNTQAD